MSKVFVLDTNKRLLDPIHPAQARQLLRNKKASVFRRFPFTIILKEARTTSPVQPLRLKLADTGLGNLVEQINMVFQFAIVTEKKSILDFKLGTL